MTQERRLPRRIAVTGASGYLGTAIVRALCARPEIESVLALDLSCAGALADQEKVTFVAHDVRRDFASLVADHCDAIVHLAYPLAHQRQFDDLRPYCTDVIDRVMEAAQASRSAKVLLCSSTTVYGARQEDDDVLFTEQHPPRPNPGYHYARGKQLMEEVAARWQDAMPRTDIVNFRPCIVIGPNAGNYLVEGFFGTELAVQGTDPRIQFCHEDDLASGVLHLLQPGVRGPYNVAPDDSMRRSEINRLFDISVEETSYADVKERMAGKWDQQPRDPRAVPPTMLDYLCFSWVASNERLKRDTGYAPRYGSDEAVLSYFRTFRRRWKTRARQAREVEEHG